MFSKKIMLNVASIMAMMAFAVGQAGAQPLEDVSLQFGDTGVVATIKLSGPVRYLRHFPENSGRTLEIFYDRVQDASKVDWVDLEERQSPPSGLIPGFTVTTHDQKVRPKLTIEFTRDAQYTVTPGPDNRSFLITIKPDKQQRTLKEVLPMLPVVKPLTALPPAADQTTADTNQQGFEMMSAGRNALSSGDNAMAIEVFNKLLLLPPNAYTQDAQEWVGVARERSGQGDRAKAEYELYIKMYPSGEGVERVKIRLAGVGDKKSATLLGTESTEGKKEAQSFAFGGISSRYYYGTSTVDATYLFNNTQSTFSNTVNDQSMLVTTLDATQRTVSEGSDNRLVFRDIMTNNLLTPTSVNSSQNVNRVNAAYWESKDRANDYSFRLGRQTGYGAGIPGRYDGASGSYGSADNWKTNAVIGRVADFSSVSKPVFYGASVDRGPISLYALNQTVDGVLDRRAVGSELRYFESGKMAYAQVDYDVTFRALNVAMINGSVGIDDAGTNLNFMLDHRLTPSISSRNALIGSTATSVTELLQLMTENQMRDLARSRTGTSNFSQIGVTHPLSTKWTVGGDLKLSTVSGLPAITDPALTALPGTLPVTQATPGPGATRTVSAQLIGNSLVRNLDIWSFSVNLMSGATAKGKSLFAYNHTLLKEKWTLDSSWLYFTQDDSITGTVTRNTPTVRATYRYRDQLSFDGDLGLEFSKISGIYQTATASRKFFSLGFRWDF